MNKAIAFFLLFVSIGFLPIPVQAEAGAESDPISGFILDGSLSGTFGSAASLLDYREGDDPNRGLAWGLINLKYRTPELYGFSLGTWLVGVQEIWQEHRGDYDGVFAHELDLRNLNLSFKVPSTSLDLTLGRVRFLRNPSMDGDSHEGIGASCLLLDGLEAYAALVHRWINNDNTDLNAKGITGWVDVEDVNDRAADVFLSLMLSWSPWEEVSVSPYFDYQENVMAVVGCELLGAVPLDGEWSLGFDGIYAYHGNLVPDSIAPGYENVDELLLHGCLAWRSFSLGAGWYWISDDRGDIMAGLFDTFDPLEKDDYYPYDDLNDASEVYLDFQADFDPVRLELYWAWGKNRAYDVRTQEFNLWAYWDIVESLELAGFLVWTDYDAGDIPDYNQFGSSLVFKF